MRGRVQGGNLVKEIIEVIFEVRDTVVFEIRQKPIAANMAIDFGKKLSTHFQKIQGPEPSNSVISTPSG